MPDQENFVTALQEENEEEEEEVEQDEEAPSLCDLPLTGAGGEQSNERRRSLSEMAEFFEFLTPNLNCSSHSFSWNDLVWPLFSSTADEDLIISEKLRNLTSNPPPPPPSHSLLLSPASTKTRRSECLNESEIATRSSSIRSLGHCRIGHDLLSNRSNRMNHVRFPSDRAISCHNNNGLQRRSPPWYRLALGPLRFPPAAEIELRRGAKILQSRSPTTLFPAAEKASCDRSAWKLINALSCKSHGTVAATTPIHQ